MRTSKFRLIVGALIVAVHVVSGRLMKPIEPVGSVRPSGVNWLMANAGRLRGLSAPDFLATMKKETEPRTSAARLPAQTIRRKSTV